jgi:hypothetical protein
VGDMKDTIEQVGATRDWHWANAILGIDEQNDSRQRETTGWVW